MAVEIKTPLRLKYRNSIDRTGDFHILLRSCIRRYESLCILAFGNKPSLPWKKLLEGAYLVENNSKDIQWKDYRRYSSRQKATMLLGGIEGKLEYRGDLTDLYPYIQLGEALGVGKGTSFGFGRYRIIL
jgi:CRISPR/Cas system endoribonuclease Cas6 (RAMP superfamily)